MPSYLDFYELKEAPFDAQPGKGPVLATQPLRDTLAWVSKRIDADDSILCVSGVPGVGRSSVARVPQDARGSRFLPDANFRQADANGP